MTGSEISPFFPFTTVQDKSVLNRDAFSPKLSMRFALSNDNMILNVIMHCCLNGQVDVNWSLDSPGGMNMQELSDKLTDIQTRISMAVERL
jgi:hypothetical protein